MNCLISENYWEDAKKNTYLPPIQEIDRALSQKRLINFVKFAWDIVEPSISYVDGWHIHAICEHLEAVSNGEINKLLINVPPQHMKSLAVSVFWPVWDWIKNPWRKYIFSSYAETLATRDSLKCRRIIQSPWYQNNWGDVFSLTSDQNEKRRFENSKGGRRLSTSVSGSNTGEGAHIVVSDDPHNVAEQESVSVRKNTILWWTEVMSTRLSDRENGAMVIIMQRINEGDLSGYAINTDKYTHLCLPMRYEGNRINSIINGKKFEDPRKIDGELLWPEKNNEMVVKDWEEILGSYGTASQLQQRPSPRGGGMFRVEDFKIVKAFRIKTVVKSVRYWDKAGTEDAGKYTAGVLMHQLTNGTFVISDCVRGQWSAQRREKVIKQCAQLDRSTYGKVENWVEQEPGSGGKESAENTVLNLAGYIIKAEKVTGAKEVRAEPYSIQLEAGNIYLLNKSWTKEFLKEHENFPMGKFSDQVDSSSGAFNKLTLQFIKKKVGTF